MPSSRRNSVKISDGIFKQNIVLMSGLFAGPVVGAASTWENALALSFVFSLVTLVSVGLCRLLPKKITFAVRIVLYALISALTYIPVMLLAQRIFPAGQLDNIALYLVITVTNPLIMSKTESRFFLRTVPVMYKDLLGFVLGFDVSCLLVGAIRDVLTDKMIANFILSSTPQIPTMDRVYCGFILVGVLAGLCRFIYNKRVEKRKKSYAAKASDTIPITQTDQTKTQSETTAENS